MKQSMKERSHNEDTEDTIAAISTAVGSGGICVLRVSGRSAIEVVDRVFEGRITLRDAETHRVYFGKIIKPGSGGRGGVAADSSGAEPNRELIDEVLVTVFRAPSSYTKEDVVEISCHGGRFISNAILCLLLDHGARLAEPGEFTKRAFLNGRLDLSQAEAVADIIRAKSAMNLSVALSQYRGVFSAQIRALRQRLIDVCSVLEMELDFAEEDVEFADREEVSRQLDNVGQQLETLLSTFSRGKILREGARLVIAGKPNVGKSSLLNALLKEERAIVTELPGTTRDVLEEQLDIGGVYFRIIDTAGIRDSKNRIEIAGVSRTLTQIRDADIILFLFDGSRPLGKLDVGLVEQVFAVRKKNGHGNRNGILVAVNKIDLERKLGSADVRKLVGDYPTVEISAKEHLGLQKLEENLVKIVLGEGTLSVDQPMVSNLRQKTALEHATESLRLACASLEEGLSSEFVALDLRACLDHLGEVIGEVTTEDILGNIFSRFCIGK